MSQIEQVIDIERNENISIEVSSPVVVETRTEENVLVNWKRVIIGTSLILTMVLSLGGGAIASYLLRKDLHKPLDPYNVWPDTDYENQCHPEGVEDLEYSNLPNNHLLIKNGSNNYFTVANGSNSDVFMAVYMIENLFDSKNYAIHVVSSTNKSDLSPVVDLDSINSPWELRNHNMFNGYGNGFEYYYESPPGVCLAESLANDLRNISGYYGDQNAAMNDIADKINQVISSKPEFYYHPTTKKTGSYIFPFNYNFEGQGQGIGIALFDKLKALRDAKREEAEKANENRNSSGSSKIQIKPRFKNIEMATLAELGN